MILDESSREGWAPVIGTDATLEDVVDQAFDYRGDVTIERRGGTPLVGYLYNRERRVPEPFVAVYDSTGASHTIRYAEISRILFTGKDPAAGKSYQAWKARRAAQEPAPER